MVVWIGGRQLKRCRNCGHLFAFKHHAEWYCSDAACQASKAERVPKRKPYVRKVRKPAVWQGVRAAELDAKAALAELQAWAAQERVKW